jgi:hypothetical protein
MVGSLRLVALAVVCTVPQLGAAQTMPRGAAPAEPRNMPQCDALPARLDRGVSRRVPGAVFAVPPTWTVIESDAGQLDLMTATALGPPWLPTGAAFGEDVGSPGAGWQRGRTDLAARAAEATLSNDVRRERRPHASTRLLRTPSGGIVTVGWYPSELGRAATEVPADGAACIGETPTTLLRFAVYAPPFDDDRAQPFHEVIVRPRGLPGRPGALVTARRVTRAELDTAIAIALGVRPLEPR